MISGTDTATLTPNGKHVSISRIHEISIFNICLGATLIDKIGEFRLSEELGSRKFRPEAQILRIFSIEVAPKYGYV